ncbi:MAG: M56 family metallopeptidase [Actinobacteria bacterium]|nr:MAG: M56 family metallopeptidase [Actinomycetota bacterium]
MGLNAANRAFVGIVLVAGAVFGLFAGTACWVFSMVAYTVVTDGLTALTDFGTLAAILLIVLLVATIALAVRSLRTQLVNTRHLGNWVRDRSRPLPAMLVEAAGQAGLGGRVDLVDGDGAFSFAYGITRPRVAVSVRLVDSLSGEELGAVLDHERYHVVNYDPLKVVLARSLPDALFFLPALAELRGRYVAARELAADRRAMRSAGPAPVAGALYKVVAGPPGVDLGAAAAIGGGEALDARVDQLESGTEPPMRPLSRNRVLASVVGGGVLVAAAAASFISFVPLMAKLCTGR